jgi:hypothetical protein
MHTGSSNDTRESANMPCPRYRHHHRYQCIQIYLTEILASVVRAIKAGRILIIAGIEKP